MEVLFGGEVLLLLQGFLGSFIFSFLTFVTRQKVNYTILYIISKALKLQVCLLWLLSFGALLVVQGNQAWNCDVILFGWCLSCTMLAFINFHKVYFIYLVMYVET